MGQTSLKNIQLCAMESESIKNYKSDRWGKVKNC